MASYTVRDTKTGKVVRVVKDGKVVSRGSSGGGGSSSNKSTLITDTIKVGGKVIVGFTDSRTGEFSPSGAGDNSVLFNQLSKQTGSKNTSQIRNVLNNPSVEQQLETQRQDAIRNENKLTRELVKSSKLYETNLNKLKRGQKVDYINLKNQGLSMDKINKLINFQNRQSINTQFQNKRYNISDTNKLISNNKSRTAILDKQTQDTLNRININDASEKLGLPKLNINSSNTEFNKRFKLIQDIQSADEKSNQKNLNKNIKEITNQVIKSTKNLKMSDSTRQALIKQAVEGTPLTPQQQKEFWKAYSLSLPKKFIYTFGSVVPNIIASNFNYGKNLVVRYNSGENNPLFNDLKKLKFKPVKTAKGISLGVGKEIGDLINFVLGVKGVTINSKGESFDGIIATGSRALIEYSMKVTKEVINNKNGLNTLKKDLTKLANTSKAVGKGSIDVIKFVKEKPIITAFVVGAAISVGIINSKKSFFSNPEENIGRALVWLFPGTIIKGGIVTTKLGVRSSKVILKELQKGVNALKKSDFNKLKALVNKKGVTRKELELRFIDAFSNNKTFRITTNELKKLTKPQIKSLFEQQKVKVILTESKNKETVIKNITKIIKNPSKLAKDILQTYNTAKLNRAVRRYNNKVYKFRIGTTEEVLKYNLAKFLNTTKSKIRDIIQKIKQTSITKNIKKINNKKYKFTIGTKKEIINLKISKLMNLPLELVKELIRGFKINRINNIANKISNKKIKFRVGTSKQVMDYNVKLFKEFLSIPKQKVIKAYNSYKKYKLEKGLSKLKKKKEFSKKFKIETRKEAFNRIKKKISNLPNTTLNNLLNKYNVKQLNSIVNKIRNKKYKFRIGTNKDVINFNIKRLKEAINEIFKKSAIKKQNKKIKKQIKKTAISTFRGKKGQIRVPKLMEVRVKSIENGVESLTRNKIKSNNLKNISQLQLQELVNKSKKVLNNINKALREELINVRALKLLKFRVFRSLANLFKFYFLTKDLKAFNNKFETGQIKIQNFKKIFDSIKVTEKDFKKNTIFLREQIKIKVTDRLKAIDNLKITNMKLGKITKITPKPPKTTRRIRLPDFDSPQLKDKLVKFKGTYVERKFPNKNYNKRTNPRVTKTYVKQTTKNKLLKFLGEKADSELVRAISKPKIVSIIKKSKDIAKPKVLNKFKKTKKGYLEKPKFAFDTKTEVQQAKTLRKKAKINKKNSKKKKTSKKRSKSTKKK